MRHSIKNIFPELLSLGFVCGILYLTCSENGVSKKEKEIRQKVDRAISEMCIKYNADTNGIAPIRRLARDKQIYSIYLQSLFIKGNNQPIFFKSSAVDVVEKSDGYHVHFITKIDFVFSHIEFVLRCTEEQAFKVASRPSDVYVWGDDYAVVAVIKDVKKLIYKIDNYKTEFHDEYGGYAISELVLDISNNFIATGECLDLLSIEELEEEIQQEQK